MPVVYFWDKCPNCVRLCKFILQYITPEGVAVYGCARCGQEVIR